MKKFLSLVLLLFITVGLLGVTQVTEAKTRIKSYNRSSGVNVKSHIRYKADGYKFNNYQYRPDRGYRR